MKDRTLLMIPGPIEFEPAVLTAMGAPTTSHVAPNFIQVFGDCLKMMRDVWQSPSAQPFAIAGSGTLAMDSAAANLIEPGDRALVLSTGYFGDRYKEILTRYGAEVDVISCELGGTIDMEVVENTLKKKQYCLLTFTHVDTSTAVRVDPKPIGELGQKYGVLTILDGVCSVAGEEIRQEDWGIDVVLTASQKAIGVPPGLALFTVSPRAMDQWKKRDSKVGNYYADWSNWLPIMQAYEAGKPSYFATPAVNLFWALHTSLKQILAEGMDNRFARHNKLAKAFRDAARAMGLKLLPNDETITASTLTAAYYPDNISGPVLLKKIKEAGVVVAGGLHPELKTKYFRVGHMGAVNPGDILETAGAIDAALFSLGHEFERGSGLLAAQRQLFT